MAEAKVISSLQLPKYGPGGTVTVQTQVTYIVGIQPPRTIVIDKAEPTDDEIAQAIRDDIIKPSTVGPRTIII